MQSRGTCRLTVISWVHLFTELNASTVPQCPCLSLSRALSPPRLMAQWSQKSTVAGTMGHKSWLVPKAAPLSAHWVPSGAFPGDLWHIEEATRGGRKCINSYKATSWVTITKVCFRMHYEDERSHGQVRAPVPKWHLLLRSQGSKWKRVTGSTLCLLSLERGMIVYCSI